MNNYSILWISNLKFPQLAKHLGEEAPVLGGWMFGLAENLRQFNIKITIASPGVKNAYYRNIETYDFITIKEEQTSKLEKIKKSWAKINNSNSLKFDLVHVHGTESSYGLAFIETFPEVKHVISIQGLISLCARYYLSGISNKNILLSITLRDIIRMDNLFQAKRKFKKRGLVELKYLQKCENFIGRTEWDRAHIWKNNIKANYFHCNEILRSSFYNSKKWNIKKIKKNSIFLSQGSYPIKGLHKVLEAANILKNEFPNLEIRIGGPNIIQRSGRLNKLKVSNYANYILKIISQYKLENIVQFLGNLNEEEMIKEYLNCNIFVCPSSIENSPNSLGEAQLLGVPTIASYVGGIPSMAQHKVNSLLYRFEEVEMLAKYISEMFLNENLCESISKNGINASETRHNPIINANAQMDIYKKILSI